MSAVSSVNSTSQTNTQTKTQASENNKLDRNAFLNLLTTQLKNQDPMNPMDNTEFIAQTAQFSSLEQLQNMNDSIQSLVQSQSGFSALNLIGKTVEALNPNGDETTIKGKVDSIKFQDGSPMLKVGTNEIPISYVMNVS